MHQDKHQLFAEVSQILAKAFVLLEGKLPKPKLVDLGHGPVFRYHTQTIEAAIIQKLARVITGLNASLILLEAGYFQELSAIFRILDEFNEDVTFLCDAVRTGDVTALHKEYLDYFYQEEFDNPNPLLSTQKRSTIPRRKIHAALARMDGQEINPSDAQELWRTISQTYSGFVHGASPHIMDMFGGIPPSFHILGMLGTPRADEYYVNAWDYFDRSLLTMMFAALSLGQLDLLQDLYKFREYFEQRSGKTNWESPAALLDRLKRQ